MNAFTLTNARGMEVRFIARGGIIVSMRVPDRAGVLADVTPGYDAVEDYSGDPRYLGALIGRYANRIARGRFTLDGVTHELARNEGENQLHGGPGGFHQAIWDVELIPERREALLRHRSESGDQGYPGALDVRVTYSLTDANEFIVDYGASTEAPTPVNFTQHAYFNLAGHDTGDILGHELTLNSSAFTPVDGALIPTGEIRPVAGTPFDFRSPRLIGERIAEDDEQLAVGRGYDHNFVIDRRGDAGLVLAARLHDPGSGRVLEILTTEPGIQFYSGSGFANGPRGKGGHGYVRAGALALETQHFPDSPNHPGFPSTILRPGEQFRSRTVYRFSVR